MNYALFWNALGGIGQCVEAIVVAGSAFALFRQVKLMRQESGMNLASAIDWLGKFLARDSYNNRIGQFLSGDPSKRLDKGFYLRRVGGILGEYDQLSYLIESNYFNKEILFRFNSNKMRLISEQIEKVTQEPDSREDMKKIIALNQKAYQLIQDGCQWNIEANKLGI